jgi:hypothetical protein
VWEDNDKTDFEEIGREGKVSIHVVQEKNKWKDFFYDGDGFSGSMIGGYFLIR